MSDKTAGIDPVGPEEQGQERRSCFQRVKDVFSLVPQNATPPNWGFLWLVFISLFSSAFTLTFLFPFLPEMVKTFGYTEKEKGTYVGLVASSVFAGRAVGSFFWGWLSDFKGRRLVLLITIVLNGLFSFLFGFVGTLELAMAIRFLAGLSNGTVGVAKTVLYDVSDNTNQAFHMSVISIAWGSGLILGPTVGGYLALPPTKYPSIFHSQGFFADYPFILPSVCCLVVCGIVFIIVFIKFQEPKLVLNREYEVAVPAEDNSCVGPMGGDSKTLNSSSTVAASQPLLNKLPSLSSASIPSQVKMGMSLETLHCESEIMYYYAQVQSVQSDEGNLSGERMVSISMHNLSPRSGLPFSDEQELPPVARHRSYSHGDQSYAPKSLGRLSREGGAVMVNNREIVAGMDKNSLISGAGKPKQDKNGGSGASIRQPDALLGLGEKCQEKDNKPVKKRSKLSLCWHSVQHSAFVQILSMSDVRHSVALYTIMSFAVIGYEDVFTIFASTAVEYDGLGFSTDEIGTALGAVSIPLIVIQVKIYPLLVARFGIKRAYLVCIFFLLIPIQLMPLLHLLVDQKLWLWLCLVAVSLPLRVAANSCFAGSSLLINNSVTSDMAGKANGVGMTATAIARTIAPTLGGAMFSWSVKMSSVVGAPLDVSLTFVFFGFVLFISGLQCVFLPDHLGVSGTGQHVLLSSSPGVVVPLSVRTRHPVLICGSKKLSACNTSHTLGV